MSLSTLFHTSGKLSPLSRRTLALQLVLNATTAPYMAMTQYALYILKKTFGASDWSVALLYALSNFYFLLGILVSDKVQRSDKIAWITWPNLAAFALMLPLGLMRHDVAHMAVFFIAVVVGSQLLRTPIYMAQSILYRTHFPPTVRSWAMAVNLAIYMFALAAFSWAVWPLMERSELWVGPVFALSALIGIAGTVYFNRLGAIKDGGEPLPSAIPSRRYSMADQFALLKDDRGFRDFEISYMLFGAGCIAMTVAFPIYLKTEFAASHKQAMNAINVVPMLTSAVMLPLWGTLLDRKNPLIVRSWLMILWAITPATYYFTRSMWGVYLATFVLGLVQGGGTLIWHLGVNYYSRANNVALYMGVHQTLTGARSIFMPFATILIGQRIGYRAAMLVWVGMMTLGGLIMWSEVRREKRLGILSSFQQKEAMQLAALEHEAEMAFTADKE